MKQFYMLVEVPGSGKSTYANELIRKHSSLKYFLLRHDDMLKSNMAIMGRGKAKTLTHQQIIQTLQNLTDDLVIYDGVNGNAEGRRVFLHCVKDYDITIVYFTPSDLLMKGKYEEYTDWLHQCRKSHILFPHDRIKSTNTLKIL